MTSRRQMSKSHVYAMTSTAFHAFATRMSQVPEKLLDKVGRGLRELFGVLVGAFLFASFSQWFFGVSLRQGASEIWRLPSSLQWCGFVMYLSLIAGSWSVGGAFCHVVPLVWGWLRLYQAGGK